ncbi:MAG: enoyl-CoA hydratase [Pseudomonadota bacterium]|nr:enoyl-CoA hydratase [Pseudomonadota bacterium]
MTTPETPQAIVERDGAVMRITLSNPAKKNAITGAMYKGVAAALAEAESDPAVAVAILTGAGEVFTSGNDVSDFTPRAPGEPSPAFVFLDAISSFGKPLIAQVDGLAIGVGCTMLLHCDLVYASDRARLQLPFVNLGLVPEAASSLLLPRLAGMAKASELLMFGEMFGAEEAREIGIVNAVLPAADLPAHVAARAAALAARPRGAMKLTKALIRDLPAARIKERMAAEGEIFGRCIAGPEFREAAAAFREKRAPDFSRIAAEG